MPNQYNQSEQLLRNLLSGILGDDADAIAGVDDLIARGLGSLDIMRLAGQLMGKGYDVTFADMASSPSVNAWLDLMRATGNDGEQVGAVGSGPQADATPDATSAAADVGALAGPERFSLTQVQHAYMVGRRDGQELGGTACHAYMEFAGREIDPQRLEDAAYSLIALHPMLRASILDDGTGLISPECLWPGLTVYDLRASVDALAELDAVRSDLKHQRLAIEDGEVIDIRLSLLPGQQCVLHLNIDLVVADVMSVRIILEDLATLYDGGSLPRLGLTFAEYQDMAGEDAARLAAARDYWKARLPQLPGGPRLPFLAPLHSIAKTRFSRYEHIVSHDLWHRFCEQARENGVTPSMAIAALYAKAISGWSENKRFLLNLPLFNRQPIHADVSRIVSDFTSLILLEADTTSAQSLAGLAAAMQQRFQTDIAHSAFSGVEVLRELARLDVADPKKAPVVFSSNIGGQFVADAVEQTFGPLTAMLAETPQVLLDHQIYDHKNGLQLAWDYVADLLDANMVEDMFSAYCGLVELYCTHEWSEPFGELLPARQATRRQQVNASWAASAGSQLLHARFFEYAAKHPSAIALKWAESKSLSYGELREMAIRIAGGLVAEGLGEGDRIIVRLPHGPQQVAAVLGVLATGAVYVPVGVEHPDVRVGQIRAQADASAIIDAGNIDRYLAAAPLSAVLMPSAGSLAYIIFTSGSTGVPKGVALSHQAAWNTIADVVRKFGLGPEDCIFGVSALDFDLSVFDIFGALSFGASIVLPNEEERRSAFAWRRLVVSHKATIWNSTPALLDVFLDELQVANGLRLAMVSGDWVPLGLRGKLPQSVQMVAMGGATEAGIWSNYYEVERLDPTWPSIPYGYPLANQMFRVVGEDGQDCPDWAVGELWIGGASLAEGYYGDPQKTATAFIVLPDGSRWYKTGDMGRYRPGAVLEFLGRMNAQEQVKIRGHRIELGEIEAALLACGGVSRAGAVVCGERGSFAVHAFVSMRQGREFSAAVILEQISQQLPSHFLPQSLTQTQDWPITVNGKVDRLRLAAMVPQPEQLQQAAYSAPQTPAEQAVAGIWADLLGVEQVGRQTSFFAVGGDSLMASRAVGRIRAAGYASASLQALFDTDTLQEYCQTLGEGEPDTGQIAGQITADPQHRFEPFCLTEVQLAYLVNRQDSSTEAKTGTTYALEFAADDIDVSRLDAAWQLVQGRHDMLRAVVREDGTQLVLPFYSNGVAQTVAHIEEAECATAEDAAGLVSAILGTVFDIGIWPLHRIVAVRFTDAASSFCQRLVFCFDYTVLDAYSIMSVLAELLDTYAQLGEAGAAEAADRSGLAPPADLSPDVTFRDYVLGCPGDEAGHAAALAYWQEAVGQLPSAPQLPLVRKAVNPSGQFPGQFARIQGMLPHDVWEDIKGQARRHGVTPTAVFLSCYAKVLSAWCGGTDLTINMTAFDRPEVHPHIYRIAGDFTTLLPVACKVATVAAVADCVLAVQKSLASALEHKGVSAVWVQKEMARQQAVSGVILPVVFTSALGLRSFDFEGGGMKLVGGLSQTPQVWLDHQLLETASGVMLSFDYDSGIFPEGMLSDLFDAYLRAVRYAAVADWAMPFPNIMPLAQAEVRRKVNNSTAYNPGSSLLHARFFALAAEQPGLTALRWGNGQAMTYGKLAERSLRIAAGLIVSGVRPEELIAVRLDKGPDQVASVLGVLACGAAYVPIGVSQPDARVAVMLGQAGIKTVIDAGSLAGLKAAEPLPGAAEADDSAVAYVIHTSGSTGMPKGVSMAHAAAWNTIADVVRRFGLGSDDAVFAVSALDFDLSVFDIFGSLSFGATLVLPSEEERRDVLAWRRLVREHGVTVWNSTPALLDVLLDDGPEIAAGIRLAMVSGDWVPCGLRDKLPAHTRLIAMGGATEAGIWSNWFDAAAADDSFAFVPYGYPLANQSYRVVDDNDCDCPDWVPGELLIGGASLALGYLNDAVKTRESFIQAADGSRWYRTGDRGCYRPGGIIEFMGRKDRQAQVKVRGHRVELGEVEAALAACPGAVAAVVVVAGEQNHLFAAVVPQYQAADNSALEVAVEPIDWQGEEQRLQALLADILDAGLHCQAQDTGFDLVEMGVDARFAPALRLWQEWRSQRNEPVLPLDVAGEQDSEYYQGILTGSTDALDLLNNERLAPDALFLSRPGASQLLSWIGGLITKTAKALGRPVKVAEYGCRSGRVAQALLGNSQGQVSAYHLLDESQAMLAAAAARLSQTGVDVAATRIQPVIGLELYGGFDLVLAVNSLHLFKQAEQVEQALGQCRALLAPHGQLVACDPVDYAPTAIVSASLLYCAQGNGCGALAALRSAREWLDMMGKSGLAAKDTQVADGLFVVSARRTPESGLAVVGCVDALAEALPSYMIPERIGMLSVLPLGNNGKVDKASVAAWAEACCREDDSQTAYEPPQGSLESTVSEVWSQLLGGRRVGRHDNFFSLGGDSLSATRMVSMLARQGYKASLKNLFEAERLRDFSQTLVAGQTAPATPAGLVAQPGQLYEEFPLTEVQEAYTIGQSSGLALGGVGAYCFFLFQVDNLGTERFAQAWQRLFERHAALRTLLVPNSNRQRVASPGALALPLLVEDSGLSRDEAYAKVMQAMSQGHIDLTTQPPFAVMVSKCFGGSAMVGIGFDNTMLDGLSMTTVLYELTRLYDDPQKELPELDISFRDFVVGYQRDPQSVLDAQQYWSARLTALPPAPQLPLAADPGQIASGAFQRLQATIAAPAWQRIKEQAREHGVTPSTALIACYARVLSAWSGGIDVTLNLTVFDRPPVHPDLDKVLGDFTTLLPLACRVTAASKIVQAIKAVQKELAASLGHRDVSGVWIQRELARNQGSSGVVLPVVFTSALGFSQFDFDQGFLRYVDGLSQTPQVWLDHQVMERDGGVFLSWDYVGSLFPEGLVPAMFEAYLGLVEQLVQRPWESGFDPLIPQVQQAERDRVNRSVAQAQGSQLLHTRFFQLALTQPDAQALGWGEDDSLSYGELAQQALRVAGGLAAAGIGVGDYVAVRLPKGSQQVVAVLGVLAAAAAYIPIGVSQPQARVKTICEQAEAKVVIDASRLEALLDSVPLAAPATPDNRAHAYVIFTSGSTGVPKGVAMSHRAAWNTIVDVVRRFGLGPEDSLFALSALDFDLSVFDIFGTLSFGARMVIPDEKDRRDMQAWQRMLAKWRVTVWNSVPALLDVLLDDVSPDASALHFLRLALVSGDWVPLGLRDKLPGDVRLIAMGGATEAGIWSNYYDVVEVMPSWRSVPYGFPLSNQSFTVVGADGRACPDWVAGELWIGGQSLAQGYLGDPVKTSQSFIADAEGQRWYRTGDLGRYLPGAILEFLGRLDAQKQVKIRGHRVELGDVEAAIAGHPHVLSTLALALGGKYEVRLFAFVIAEEGVLLTAEELSAHLSNVLPPYMLPHGIAFIDAWPLNVNGKVDREVLAQIAQEGFAKTDESEDLDTDEERLVAEVWMDILGVEELGKRSNFFELGGDSLSAIRMVSALEKQHGICVSLQALMDEPTIVGLCSCSTRVRS